MAELEEVTIDTVEYKPTKVKRTVWRATDGTEFPFTQRVKAEKHQAELDRIARIQGVWDTVKIVDLDYDEFIDGLTWYHAETEDQLELIKERLGWGASYANHSINGVVRKNAPHPQVGDWIAVKYESGGDYRDEYEWFTFEFVLSQVQAFLDRAKQNGMVNDVPTTGC